MMVNHAPQGNPCIRPGCGKPFDSHRTKHQFKGAGERCVEQTAFGVCGLRERCHTGRREAKKPLNERRTYWFWDGEGAGELPHRYTMLAASNQSGTKQECIEDPQGLST